jgi:Tfp pilus assembly protein PilZ
MACMRNKRSKPRRNSPHRVNVLDCRDDRPLGRLVNITTGGLMFLSGAPYEEGATLAMRLPLPTMANGKTAIEVTGKVIWCKPDESPKYHRTGVAFEELGAEEGYLIETVLQRLHLVG